MTRREALPAIFGTGGGVSAALVFWRESGIADARHDERIAALKERVEALEASTRYLHGEDALPKPRQ